jgi:hypothetical protein
MTKATNMIPLTPVRKLFLKLDRLKSPRTLGKRRRSDDADADADTEQQQQQQQQRKPASPRLALQNEDTTEDVVIITTLDCIPFCCHEDLLTMSRDQLITVARTLNAKLPAALSIDVSHSSPDTFIRNSIEIIVGIRRDVPPAPKAVRLRADAGPRRIHPIRSPPSSPLAIRTRPYDFTMAFESPRLEKLDEEDEDVMNIDGPSLSKRRRVSAPIDNVSSEKEKEKEKEKAMPLPRRHMVRAKSYQVSSTSMGSPIRNLVARSSSQRLPIEIKQRSKKRQPSLAAHSSHRSRGRPIQNSINELIAPNTVSEPLLNLVGALTRARLRSMNRPITTLTRPS